MLISRLLGGSNTTALEALEESKKKRDEEQKNNASALVQLTDRVTISDAARALLERACCDSEAEQGTGDENDLSSGSGIAQGQTSNSGKSATEIEARIKKLQNEIMQIQQGAMPDAAKEILISGKMKEVGELMQELNALKQQAAAA